MESTALVALDARLTRQMSVGMKTYARELAARLPRIAPDLRFTAFRQGENFGLDEQVRLPRAIRHSGAALTHFLSIYTPVLPVRPYIVTVHDLIHLHFPHYFKSKVPLYYQTVVRFVARRAARVITDDRRTVADLQHFLGVDPDRVRVVALGVEDRFLSAIEPVSPPRPYLLYVGNHRAHKDVATLLRAWNALPETFEIDLYLTGADDFGGALAAHSTQSRRAVALGDLEQDELARYYAGASALVHPALLEGFGLPMLEAMACGCPVVAAQQSLPGVLADAALTFGAGDADAARDALLRVLSDAALRTRLVKAGRERAGMLTWDRCAMETARIYREVIRENARV